MQRVNLFFVKGLVQVLGSMGPWLRYRVSDVACWLIRDVVRYRTKLVDANLERSFPDLSVPERQKIRNDFFRWMTDLFLETFAMQVVSRAAIKQMSSFPGESVLLDLHAKGHQHVVVTLGHFGNWEAVGQRWAVSDLPTTLYIVYKRIGSIGFDKAMYDIRTRYGLRLIEYAETVDALKATAYEPHNAYAFIADQAPHKNQGLWVDFLHQQTAFFQGWARYAQQYNYPVCFIDIKQPARGKYTMNVEVLEENPRDRDLESMVHQFSQRMQQQIRQQPHLWLWSHKRWKHAMPTNESCYPAPATVAVV